jgi:hypothetical protein
VIQEEKSTFWEVMVSVTVIQTNKRLTVTDLELFESTFWEVMVSVTVIQTNKCLTVTDLELFESTNKKLL